METPTVKNDLTNVMPALRIVCTGEGENSCPNQKHCIPRSSFCDDKEHCNDKSDEANCTSTHSVCSSTQIKCKYEVNHCLKCLNHLFYSCKLMLNNICILLLCNL